jgi:hypothetical protein
MLSGRYDGWNGMNDDIRGSFQKALDRSQGEKKSSRAGLELPVRGVLSLYRAKLLVEGSFGGLRKEGKPGKLTHQIR